LIIDESEILDNIVREVRSYRGLIRKASIGQISSLFSFKTDKILAAKGEDGAIIRIGDRICAFSADGIMDELIDKNPHWAGYCSILVNVHDMLAMRAIPTAAVNVISSRDEKSLSEIVAGMNEACDKFDVPMVGGHLHPYAESNSVSVAMMGEVIDGKPVLSSTARPGDSIILICDCRGSFTPGIPYSWDCTSMKSKSDIKMMRDMLLVALSYFNSVKDISNPGLLGTLAMLLEASGLGGEVDIGEVVQPSGVQLVQWLTTYHGFGFIGTAPMKLIGKIASELTGSGLSMAVIGETKEETKLKIRKGSTRNILFDFSKDI